MMRLSLVGKTRGSESREIGSNPLAATNGHEDEVDESLVCLTRVSRFESGHARQR